MNEAELIAQVLQSGLLALIVWQIVQDRKERLQEREFERAQQARCFDKLIALIERHLINEQAAPRQ